MLRTRPGSRTLRLAAGLPAAAGVALAAPTAAFAYLIAHYLTYLLVDGQRIIAAFNDPLLRGDNLLPFDLGFYEPVQFLPAAIVWSIQLAAVVGGDVVGAWAGHAATTRKRATRGRSRNCRSPR